ncbi:MAG: hypothetical protein EOP06_03735 [Proteobacteria bacterium]|nr:MAG: hypothetical protein EOP06_03735 [Pseudomonadota bacterium]
MPIITPPIFEPELGLSRERLLILADRTSQSLSEVRRKLHGFRTGEQSHVLSADEAFEFLRLAMEARPLAQTLWAIGLFTGGVLIISFPVFMMNKYPPLSIQIFIWFIVAAHRYGECFRHAFNLLSLVHYALPVRARYGLWYQAYLIMAEEEERLGRKPREGMKPFTLSDLEALKGSIDPPEGKGP